VVWFDAHADLQTPDTTTTGYLGGLALSGPTGFWDIDPPEYRLIDDGVVRHIPVGPAMVDDLDSAIDDRPVYFHLDCDVLEPGVVPTDYRVPNGISLDELGSVARRLAENRIVGVEVAEFEGSWGGNGSTR
jgi:arginase